METNSEKEELQNSNEEIENSKQEETKDLKKTEEKKERKKISFKNINWMTVFKEIAYWVFVGILILFFDYLEFKTPEKLSATNYLSMDPKRAQAFIVLFIFALVLDIALHITKIKKLQIYQKFIILAVSIGVCYWVAVPFGQGTDEVSHFLRVYEISKKYTTLNYQDTTEFPTEFEKLAVFQQSREISYDTYKEHFGSFNVISTEKADMGYAYWNMRLYSPIQYFPQAVALTVGRIVSNNILVIGTFARVGGFLAWVLLCAYAIKIVPNRKTLFMILCLLPVNIFSAVCISGDTLTNATCMVFVAMIYRKVYLKEKIELKDKIVLILSGCLMALCKIVYLPFVFLALLLKKENFDSKKACIVFIIILIALSCIVGIGWLKIGNQNLVESNAASKDQVKFILQDPLHYFLIMLHTFEEKGTDYIYQLTTGLELICHGKTTIYPIIGYIISIVVVLGIFVNEDDKDTKINIIRKVLVWLIILGVSALIATAIYVQWTSLMEIGRYMIAGIQGRYFIPVVLLLIFTIDSARLSIKNRNLISFLTIMQLPFLALIINTFVK